MSQALMELAAVIGCIFVVGSFSVLGVILIAIAVEKMDD